MTLLRWWKRMRRRLRHESLRRADEIVARADAARDDRRFAEAAGLYAEALQLHPQWPLIAIQAGHMFKEARNFAAAEPFYRKAQSELPDDADLALQLGHFYKTIDRLPEAVDQYRRAIALAPDWSEPQAELDALARMMRGGFDPDAALPDSGALAELLPGVITAAPVGELDRVEFRRLGGRAAVAGDRTLPVLAGIDAIRGVCFSDVSIENVEVVIDGTTIHSAPAICRPAAVPGMFKAVFNLWVDLSGVPAGLHILEIVLWDVGGRSRRRIEPVLVATPRDEADFPESDGIVSIDGTSVLDAEGQIRARPSMVRPARRSMLGPVRSILVLRTDQLGDMVASIPALRRLRQLFPGAQIVCLVTAANAEFAATLGLFDEIIVIDFPDDPDRRRRTMTPDEQEALRVRLAPYRFDVAIDLASSHMSRPLLQLTGARTLYGFDDSAWPWMDAGLAGGTHDPANGIEVGSQSGRIRALVERLGTLADSGAEVLRRSDLDAGRLSRFGIAAGEPFVVLHTGGRIGFSRWHGYPELARALCVRTVGRIIALVEDAAARAALAAIEGVTVIDERLPFDDLDALLSFCAAFVGNDSGPKHLASLRGVPVVSIHSARINWNEWGQEQTGTIISRRVPCAGCAIYHDVDECGKGFACVADIRVEEVLDAVIALLRPR